MIISTINRLILKPASRWEQAWQSPFFRWSLITAVFCLAYTASQLPDFFEFVENRPGRYVRDILLAQLPAYDFSLPVFAILYTSMGYVVIKGFQFPHVAWYLIVGYTTLVLLRVVALYLFPLEPPADLIPLRDPFSEIFYGGIPRKKDLFFSGHAATMMWLWFSVREKVAKNVMFIGVVSVMIMLLFQHIHYTSDIVAGIMMAILLRIGLEHLFFKNKIVDWTPKSL